jgi:uncharacterized protein (TIGR03435 family)
MINPFALLDSTRKPTLAVLGVAALAMPFVVGQLSATFARAQSATPPTPRFEVASIRLCESRGSAGLKGGGTGGPGGGSISPGRVSFACGSLANFVQRAYVTFANGHSNSPWGAPPISGGPAWVNSGRYRINAKAEGNASPGVMQGPMLQTLLEDRFKLRIHRETREVPVYALVVAKGGLKLRRVEEGSCTPRDYKVLLPSPVAGQKPLCGNGGFGKKGNLVVADIPAISIGDFSKRLSSRLDRPVIDKTGVTELFDVHLEFAPDMSTSRFGGGDGVGPITDTSEPTAGQSIFTAMQRQLGLKLEATKGPREFLVIDSAEKPFEN